MIKPFKYIALATGFLFAPFVAEAETPTLNKVAGAELVTPRAGSLTIEINKGTLVRLDRPASEVFIANPEIADVQVKSARVVYIFGRAQGETTFYALDEHDNTIFSAGISITRNLSALNKAYERMMPGAPINATTLGELVVLTGNVGAPDQAALAEQLAKSVLGTEQVMNNINVMQPTQVNLRVRIAEVSRTVLKQLGVSWEGFLSGSNAGIGIATGRDVFNLVTDPATGIASKVFIPGKDLCVKRFLFLWLVSGRLYGSVSYEADGFVLWGLLCGRRCLQVEGNLVCGLEQVLSDCRHCQLGMHFGSAKVARPLQPKQPFHRAKALFDAVAAL